MTEILKTPLHSEHVALKAKMHPFAGYDMPVSYTGIYDEAAAVRTKAGIFDVSHMARLVFSAGMEDKLHELLTCDIKSLTPGTGIYGTVLQDDGGILDDIIIYKELSGSYFLVVNACNHTKITKWISEHGGVFDDITDDTAMIALQGPEAESILAEHIPPAKMLNYFGIGEVECSIHGSVRIARTGYTGEDGFELIVSSDKAISVWKTLMSGGNVTPCGLGSRDVLRIEAGYNLYGMDMDESCNPLESGIPFAVRAGEDFIGGPAIKNNPRKKILVGLDAGTERRVVMRHGYNIYLQGEENPIGTVTSGLFSKKLGRSIGFGSLQAGVAKDSDLEVDVRGNRHPVTRVRRKFVEGSVKERK